MARPVKRRRVCGLPPVGAFRPEGGTGGAVIEVTVDEYEAVRLIDLLGLTQEECAAQMNVARTTVQAIYDSAREKLARMLAEGRPLAVQGGTYDLCGQAEHCCGRRCRRRGGGEGRCENGRLTCREEGRCPGRSGVEQNRMKQEGQNMKIAVTYENGQVFQHFGHTERFKLYEVEDGAVTASQVVDTAGSGHGALAGFLRERGVQTLICGGIGGGEQPWPRRRSSSIPAYRGRRTRRWPTCWQADWPMTRIQCVATTTRGTEPISAAATERGRATPAAIPTGLAARAAPDIRDKNVPASNQDAGTFFTYSLPAGAQPRFRASFTLAMMWAPMSREASVLWAPRWGETRKFSHSNRGESKPAPSVRPPPASSFSITSEA